MDKNKDENKTKTYPKKSLALFGNTRAKKYDAPRVVHSFSLSPETLAALTAFAEREGIKKSVALERILRERLLDEKGKKKALPLPRRASVDSSKSSPSVSAGK